MEYSLDGLWMGNAFMYDLYIGYRLLNTKKKLNLYYVDSVPYWKLSGEYSNLGMFEVTDDYIWCIPIVQNL